MEKDEILEKRERWKRRDRRIIRRGGIDKKRPFWK